ncbi:MAG: F0F1 ATP synthase subunit gamma [Acidimicrobiales bacterium]
MAGGQERILRGRIRTVQATKKITRAMELIAASRIVKAQQRVAAAVPYSEQITEVVKDLAAAGGSSQSPLLAGRDVVKTTAYVVITADRGLCGGYNAGVQRAAEGEIKQAVLNGSDYAVVAVGRKAEGYFRFRGYQLASTFAGFSDNPSYANAKEIGQYVMDLYVRGEVDRVELVYTRFISAGSQEVVQRPLVPLDRDVAAGGDGKAPDASGAPADFEFEPDPGTILDTLLPRYVEARIYAALLNAAASEHAFRQRAMKSATDNAEELIKSLSRIMNRARQDSITTEIMEIVGGAEALGGDAKKVRLVELGPLTDDGFDGYLDIRPASALAATAVGVLEPDDIEEIVGIGPVIGAHLREQGVTTFAQIAAWTPEDAARIGDEIDFPGRVEREEWIEQARQLQAKKYGN